MDANDTSYMDFLKIYFPETADSIARIKNMSPKGDTPDELKKSAAEIEEKLRIAVNKPECISDFQAYERIPQGIRSRYSGVKVPPDVMEAARRDEVLTLMEWEQHPELTRIEDVRDKVREDYGIPSNIDIPAEIVSKAAMVLFAGALAEGYSQHASRELALERQNREGLLEEKAFILTNPNLSEAEKKEKLNDWLENKWLVSRKRTRDAIEKDWKGSDGHEGNQPEKYLVHLLAKYNRATSEGKAEIQPQLAKYMQEIYNNGRMENLLAYLKERRIQAKIGHFNNETRDILANLVLKELPESEREQYLARDFRRKRGLKENMSEDRKAATVAKDLKQAQANALPEHPLLTTEERLANMPTQLRRAGIQREA